MPSTLITGANRGLGFEFARQYLADGWSTQLVVIQHLLPELSRLAEDSDDKIRPAIDVTDRTGIREATTELDGQPIDLLSTIRWHYRTAGPDHRKH